MTEKSEEKLWYPDSLEWIEIPDGRISLPKDFEDTELVCFLYDMERKKKSWQYVSCETKFLLFPDMFLDKIVAIRKAIP